MCDDLDELARDLLVSSGVCSLTISSSRSTVG